MPDSTTRHVRLVGGDVAPVAIGSNNAELVTGYSWRWLRDHADELGVEVIKVDGKSFILASDLAAALERRKTPAPATDSVELSQESELVQLRARLGKTRRIA
jgi:hypothetical protein